MRKIICNRCGAEKSPTNTQPFFSTIRKATMGVVRTYHLCDNCNDDFEDFIIKKPGERAFRMGLSN